MTGRVAMSGRTIWLPPNESSLRAWWRSTDYLSLNSAGVAQSWGDLSGRGNTLLKDGTGPSVTWNLVNGYPALTFANASSTAMSIDSAADLAPTNLTLCVVCRVTTSPASICVHAGRGDTGFKGYYLGQLSTGASREIEFHCGQGGATQNSLDGSANAATTWYIRTGTYDGQIQTLYKNGASDGTFTFASSASLDYTALTKFVVGADSALTAGRFLTGDIAEVIVFNAALSSGSLKAMHTYLGNRYAITLS